MIRFESLLIGNLVANPEAHRQALRKMAAGEDVRVVICPWIMDQCTSPIIRGIMGEELRTADWFSVFVMLGGDTRVARRLYS